MRYIFQLLPKEPLCSQLQELRHHLTSLIGPNKALDYPLPHATLLHSIADNSINAIQACDQLIAVLPAIKESSTISLPAKLLNRADNHVTISLSDDSELAQIRDVLLDEVNILEQQGQLSSSPVAETWPHITLVQDVTPENQALAREYITQNIDWIPDTIEFDQVALLARDVTLNQPYKIVARAALRQLVEQE